MKILGSLVVLSLVLNLYMIWRQHKPVDFMVSPPSMNQNNALDRKAASGLADSSKPNSDQLNLEHTAKILATIETLKQRIESLEDNALIDQIRKEGYSEQRQYVEMASETVKSRLNSSPSDEEWFWDASSDEELSLSFDNTEGFSVYSKDCRSGWCRVEVEVDGAAKDDSDSMRELQLKIDESLGRDTVIRWGSKDGNRRVLFVQ